LELWNNEVLLDQFSDSCRRQDLHGREKGDLFGGRDHRQIDWKLKIGIEQRNPAHCMRWQALCPMLDDPAVKSDGGGEAGTTGAFYIIKPGEKAGEILAHVALDGRCFRTPWAYNGKFMCRPPAIVLLGNER